MNYQDHVVVLTGASGGIGSAMAKKFTDLGCEGRAAGYYG